MTINSWIEDPNIHRTVAFGVLYLSPVVFVSSVWLKPSTYGKLHNSKKSWFGPLLPAKWCWMIFEAPNWLWVLVSLLLPGTKPQSQKMTMTISNWVLLAWFLFHYIHRSILYPLQMSSSSKFPLGIMFLTVPYCIVNGYLQTQSLCKFLQLPPDYHYSPQFIVGVSIAVSGFTLGYISDHTLLKLRRTGTYQIPRGGAFEWISSPHFLGEMLEWFGFAMACDWSLASISFAVWTAANLVPRALAQHDWYHRKFLEDYPQQRKAVFPFIL